MKYSRYPFEKPGMSDETCRALTERWNTFMERVSAHNRKHFLHWNGRTSTGKPIRALMRDTKANRAYYDHPGNPTFTLTTGPRGNDIAHKLQKMGVDGSRITFSDRLPSTLPDARSLSNED